MTRIPILVLGLLPAAAALAQCTAITLPDVTEDTQYSEEFEPNVSRKFFYPAHNAGFEDDLLEVTLRKVEGPDDWNYQFCEGLEFCRPIFAWETQFTIVDTVYSEQETEYDVEFIARSYGSAVLELTLVRSECPDDTLRQTLGFTLMEGTGVAERPARLELPGNWPNPFNPATHIPFRLEAAATVRVEVVDALGRVVAAPLAGATLPAGDHEVLFDGRGLPSGVYLYRVTTPQGVAAAPMTLLK